MIQKIWYRIFQTGMKYAAYLMPWRKPELLHGKNSILRLAGYLQKRGIRNVLVVTDRGIASAGLMNPMLQSFRKRGIRCYIYDKTVPNPTIDNIEEALALYKRMGCQAIIGFGGGSSMDCAKGVGARAACPKKQIPQMKGQLKVRRKLPLLVAVPTTSGTGSEATLAAVVTDSRTHEKYAINDLVLIPKVAVLDPMLTKNLPPHITSTTGMDALTHAVEAYIGRSNTRETRRMSVKATRLIMENLTKAYHNGANLRARSNMQRASYYAGVAFTRAYVGYVHAIAHTLGGFYSIPHGLANAVILPYVLEAYGESVYRPLAQLYDAARLPYGAKGNKAKALAFIAHIKKMNREMGIPQKLSGIQEKDIPIMAERACAEAHPLYPVPRIMERAELERIYHLISDIDTGKAAA